MTPVNANLEELIGAGVHFGHRSSRWNPKMAPYILKKRNLIHIIDIKETLRGLITAGKVVEEIARRGEYVLFVGTKRQARQITRKEAERCGMPYVVERWLGGLLTNYQTIRSRLQRLEELEELERTGRINDFSKKMISSFRREARKIKRNLGGVRDMDGLPGLLVVVDPRKEDIAVRDAIKLHIPTVAWLDTDADPEQVDIPAPANDDAIRSIEIFTREMADAVLRGRERAKVEKEKKEDDAKAAKERESVHDSAGGAEGDEKQQVQPAGGSNDEEDKAGPAPVSESESE